VRLWPLWLLLAAGPVAHAEEPLWSEGASRAALKPDAPINIQSFIKLARTLGPAVVNIIAITSAEDPRELFEHQPGTAGPGGEGRPRSRGRGQGTGFIIHKTGYVLTNTHVIENADDIRVRLADDRELTARLVGKDERTDIALLKIEAGTELPVAPLGNSDEVQIGEWVMAIGNPFGLDHTVTAGIISAKERREIRPGGGGSGFYDFLQTDASINPGNSGGPLINTRGEVIGINTAMNAAGQGIGFAIPINMVKVIAPLLRAHGRAPRSTVGVRAQAITAQLKRAFNLTDTHGALLAEVEADSAAAKAGLHAGDVIVELEGKPVRRADDFTWQIETARSGKKLAVTASRAGKLFKAELMPVAASEEQGGAPAVAARPATPGKKSPLGMTVSEISPGIARELGNPSLHGVVVMSVEPESPAVEAGVERGDLIVRVGDQLVSALDDYAKAVRGVAHGDMIKMLVKRDTRTLWVAFMKR
jgi:Do/DeqQ family serine protease